MRSRRGAAGLGRRGRCAPGLPWAALFLVAIQFAGCSGSGRRISDPLSTGAGRGTQVGEVSWYGIAERGQPTANGEPMDPQALTAAHRTLPFGTVVEVTVLATGRHIRVRINDRGPFSRGRILDLSHEAARRLGIVRQGVARASIRVVGHAYPPTGFAVQVGAFRELAGANQLADALRSEGWDRVVLARNGGGSIHRVRITGFRDRAEARETVRRLRTRGYEAFIVPEDS